MGEGGNAEFCSGAVLTVCFLFYLTTGLNYLVSHLCSVELDSFERDCFKYGDESIVFKRTLTVQFVKLYTFYCRNGLNTCIVFLYKQSRYRPGVAQWVPGI